MAKELNKAEALQLMEELTASGNEVGVYVDKRDKPTTRSIIINNDGNKSFGCISEKNVDELRSDNKLGDDCFHVSWRHEKNFYNFIE